MRKLIVLLTLLLCTTGVTHGQDETVTSYDCECLIDGVRVKRGTMPPDGGQAQWQIDAATIPLGLHQVQTRIVQHLSSGITATAIYDALCFRISDSNSHQVTATCHIDGKQVKSSTLPTDGTAQAWMLDVSDLPEGLHRVNVSITDRNRDGIVTTTSYDAMCYRTSTGNHHEVTASIFVDNQLHKTSVLKTDGSLQTFVLDMSELPEGLHQVKVNIADKDKKGNVTTAVYEATCYRVSFDSHHEVTAACYVDGELKKKSTIQANGDSQVWVLDLSELPEGIHQVRVDIADKNKDGFVATAVYEATCYRMAPGEGHDVTATCYVDDKLIQTQEIVADGGTRTWTLDLAQLPIGLHRLKVSIADRNKEGVVTTASYDAMFYRISSGETHDVTAACYVDEQLVNTTTMQTNGTAKTWTLDLATLPRGIHHVRVSITDRDSEGIATTTMYDAMCYRGVGRVVDCEYWVNDDDSSYSKIELAEPQMEYTLISLLPVPQQQIRSKKFHFEVNNDAPMLYARNDILIRFNTENGSHTDVNGEYVDYSVSQAIDAEYLESGDHKTVNRPQENAIKWYKLDATRGDSLRFNVDKACSLQLFAPDNQEVFAVDGASSVGWNGATVWDAGTYYLALHDMTATSGDIINLDYELIDHYAILRQDVKVVGNGGASNIKFDGNGFDYLDSLSLVNGDEVIWDYSTNHISNSQIDVMFDFTSCKLGKYDLVGYFDGDTRTIPNAIEVVAADSIKLDFDVSYPSQFLRGTSTTYTFKITNNGNSTAYQVPLEIQIYSSKPDAITYAKFSDNIPSIFNAIIDDIEDEDESKSRLCDYIDKEGDLLHFIVYYDSINNNYLKDGLFFVNIPSTSSIVITLTLKSSEPVYLLAQIPSELDFYSPSKKDKNRKSLKKDGEEHSLCCYREHIECIMDAVVSLADILALLPDPEFGIAACVAGAVNTGIQFFYDLACGEYTGGNNPAWYSLIENIAWSIYGCISTKLNPFTKGALACSLLQTIRDAISLHNRGCDTDSDTTPNCPPNPHRGGGKSSPVAPADPNEMLGYLAPSGSKYIAKDVTNVYYTICFENDTLAMAPANAIVLNDTIDGRVHDLNTFAPKQIRIGNRLEMLDGTPNFVKTIDMRPEINCIAQVECNYDSNRGIAKWTLSSLDPMTLEPITDYNQGLLPVNYNGNGQGEVSYDISLKKGLAEGTRIVNRAAITFDSNEPIMTPDWVNIIDGVKPTSRVIDCELMNDSVAAVSIRGEDDRSGSWRYDIYAQFDGGDWVKAASEVPIDRAAQVRVYEGIEHHFYAVLTDSADNVEVKEPVRELTFDYFSSDTETNLTLNLAKGWNWMSHNLNEPLSVDALKPNAYRIMSHDGETIKDPRYGYTGTVRSLSPTELYKVEMSTADNIQLNGKLFNSALKPVPLVQGWNWIGYPMAGAMSVNEALVQLDADEDDCIVGQDGTAVFNDGLWRGTLTTLEPGKGYLLKTSSDKPLRLNASRASVRLHAPAMEGQDGSEIWTVDIHRYPNVTPIIADLWDGYTLTSQVGYGLAAFVGDECRGIAREVNGRWMMNVYGVGGEKITFKALDRSTGLLHDISESETFTADLIGTMGLPVQLHIADASGLNNVMFDGVSVKPTLTTGPVTIEAGDDINEVEVLNAAGVTIMGYSNIPSGFTLDLGSEPDGIYLVKVTTGKNVSTVKVLKRSH